MLDPVILDIARAVKAAGGRAFLVGGYVRDCLLGLDAKDADVEVFGLELAALQSLLGSFGRVLRVGESFGVLRLAHVDADFSLPRRDSKVAAGHRGFAVASDPHLDFESAARRRDLTINSMSYDPLTDEVIDPFGGRQDLERGVLRATDARAFPRRPAAGAASGAVHRPLRDVTRPDPRGTVPQGASRRGVGRAHLRGASQAAPQGAPTFGGPSLPSRPADCCASFPSSEALVGVPQDPEWHPEGDVWVHTLLVVDEAARLRDGGDDDLALMLGALCHDLGKPLATCTDAQGRIRSPRHSERGVDPARTLLERLRAPKDLERRVCALVLHHLAPALFVRNGATTKGYRRLARKLDASGVSLALLVRVAQADHLGRTGEVRNSPPGERFLAQARRFLVAEGPPRDVVMGRHLVARGLTPGPAFSGILERCREIQDEEDWQDADRIIDAVLAERG